MARSSINNLICDNILRVVDGRKSISRALMRESGAYVHIDADWQTVERHIDFLVRDRTLREEDEVLTLTSRGAFMLHNVEKVGYVAQKIDDAQWRSSERDTRVVVRTTIIAALFVTLVWASLRLISLLE